LPGGDAQVAQIARQRQLLTARRQSTPYPAPSWRPQCKASTSIGRWSNCIAIQADEALQAASSPGRTVLPCTDSCLPKTAREKFVGRRQHHEGAFHIVACPGQLTSPNPQGRGTMPSASRNARPGETRSALP
jgi:hypothetical protein